VVNDDRVPYVLALELVNLGAIGDRLGRAAVQHVTVTSGQEPPQMHGADSAGVTGHLRPPRPRVLPYGTAGDQNTDPGRSRSGD